MRTLFALLLLCVPLALPAQRVASTGRCVAVSCDASVSVSAQVVDAHVLSPSALLAASGSPAPSRLEKTWAYSAVSAQCAVLFVETPSSSNSITVHRFPNNQTQYFYAQPDGTAVTKQFHIYSLNGELLNSGTRNPEEWVKFMVTPCVIEAEQVTRFDPTALFRANVTGNIDRWAFANTNTVHIMRRGHLTQIAIIDF